MITKQDLYKIFRLEEKVLGTTIIPKEELIKIYQNELSKEKGEEVQLFIEKNQIRPNKYYIVIFKYNSKNGILYIKTNDYVNLDEVSCSRMIDAEDGLNRNIKAGLSNYLAIRLMTESEIDWFNKQFREDDREGSF